jgi:hypothetical protein
MRFCPRVVSRFPILPPLVAACALVACDAPPGDDADGTAGATRPADVVGDGADSADPTPWIYPEGDAPPAAAPPADALEAAIPTAFEVALALDARPILALHDLVRPAPAQGTGDLAGCPALLTQDYGALKVWFWQGACTSSDGHIYAGQGALLTWTDLVNEVGTFSGRRIQMSGRITAPDGTWIEGAGIAQHFDGGSEQVAAASHAISGSWRSGGPRAPDSAWLDGSRNPSLEVVRWTYLPTGGDNVTVRGGLAFPATGVAPPWDDAITAISFEEFTVRAREAGASCPREPGGAVALRGVDGAWVDVIFDGPTDASAETDPTLCDGCGLAWHRATELGAVCVDARPLLDSADGGP